MSPVRTTESIIICYWVLLTKEVCDKIGFLVIRRLMQRVQDISILYVVSSRHLQLYLPQDNAYSVFPSNSRDSNVNFTSRYKNIWTNQLVQFLHNGQIIIRLIFMTMMFVFAPSFLSRDTFQTYFTFLSLKLAVWLWEAYSGIFLLLSSSCCVRRLMSQIQIICGVLIQVIMRQKEEKSMEWRAAPSHFLSFDMQETREGILQNISVFSHKKPCSESFFFNFTTFREVNTVNVSLFERGRAMNEEICIWVNIYIWERERGREGLSVFLSFYIGPFTWFNTLPFKARY